MIDIFFQTFYLKCLALERIHETYSDILDSTGYNSYHLNTTAEELNCVQKDIEKCEQSWNIMSSGKKPISTSN